VKLKLYVEGGGDHKSLKINCRKGFRELFEKAGFKGGMPEIVACGPRNEAFDDFKTAMATTKQDNYPVLLVDSEGPVTKDPWSHLQERDKWPKPEGAQDDQAQLMVQCMET